MDILVFTIHEQLYGVPIRFVSELFRAVSITPVPQSRQLLEGVINVRGSITPVYDLRRRLQLSAKPVALSDIFIAMAVGVPGIVVRVDQVHDLMTLSSDDIQAANGPGTDPQQLVWVARGPSGLIIIQDPATFLNAAELPGLAAAIEPQSQPEVAA